MEFQCSKVDLVRGVQAVERAVAAKGPIQVLTGIHLSVGKSGLTLTATDLEIGIQYNIPVQAREEGAIVLEGKYFVAIVRRLPDEIVDVSLNRENHLVSVKSGKSHFSVLSMSPEDFPGLPRAAGKNQITIDRSFFTKMISQTIYAASRDDTRPVLTGVLVEVEGEEIRLVATDGNRLALRRGRLESPVSERFRAIIPARALAEVSRQSLADEDKIILAMGDGQVLFTLPDGKITTRLIEGQYPNYQQVLPTQESTKLTLDRRAWMEALERASLISKEGPAIVILSIQEGIMSMKAQEAEVGQVEEQVEIEQEGENLTIAFQARFLLDMLKNTDDERVKFTLNGPVKPGILRPVSQEDFQYVVMPVCVAH